jgi:hypothetical protein
MTAHDPDLAPAALEPARSPRWPWVLLALGLIWTALVRVPLVLNAADHLDSDLAVDGLTLLDATRGHWRWHYPGTPHMGILPVFFSYIQALLWGASPITLVSGGTLLWIGVILAIFELTRRAFDLETAGWALIPLVFSSLGTIWLSGRITGGHLLTLAWHAAAFVGLAVCWKRSSPSNLAFFGLWCGLGLYLDTMFAFTLVGLGSANGIHWLLEGRPRVSIPGSAMLLTAFAVGFLPGLIGRFVDPHDAYPDQFRPLWNAEIVADHAAILGLECLPRLIAGTEVGRLRQNLAPWGRTLPDQLSGLLLHPERGRASVVIDLAGLLVGMIPLALAAIWIVLDPDSNRDPRRASVRFGLVVSSLAILAGFVLNRNIFNSDNYRYIVFLVVPWSLGFGIFARSLAHWSRRGRYAAIATAAGFAVVMTAMTVTWYRTDRKYLDGLMTPNPVDVRPWTRPRVGGHDPVHRLGTPIEVPTGVTHLLGDYWDVYKISFLSGGKVVGVPYPMYPNRFPGWSKGLGPDRGALMVLTPFPGWKDALATLWDREGRDPQELDKLKYVLPK